MIRKCLFFIFIIGFPFAYSSDLGEVVKSFNELSDLIKRTGNVSYNIDCANIGQTNQGPKTAQLYSKGNDQKIELSVLSVEEANLIFSEISKREEIPFKHPDGCFVKAHKVARLLEEKGIISGKAFLVGPIPTNLSQKELEFFEIENNRWGYHVSNVVLVRKGDKIIPYVFDPYFFDRPVPQIEWKNKVMENPEARLRDEFFTNRFVYDYTGKNAKLTKHNQEYLDDTEEQIEKLYGQYERYKDMLEFSKETETKHSP